MKEVFTVRSIKQVRQRAAKGGHMEQLLTLKEACGLLRVTAKTLRFWAATDRVPCRKVGNEWRFLPSELRQWVDGTYNPNQPETQDTPDPQPTIEKEN